MSYTYICYMAVMDNDGRSMNFTQTPTVTVWDGKAKSAIASPSPTLTNITTGLYAVEISYATKTDVLFKLVPHADDEADVGDIFTVYTSVERTVDEVDTAVGALNDLSAQQVWEYVTRTLTAGGGATAQQVWEYATRTLTQSATSITAAVSGSSITDIRGNSWDIDVADLTLDANKIQFAIKKTPGNADSEALLLVDTDTGLLVYNGATATDATKASLSYAGTTLTVTVDAEISALLAVGTWQYGIQQITAGGVVTEPYQGDFTISNDIVRATE